MSRALEVESSSGRDTRGPKQHQAPSRQPHPGRFSFFLGQDGISTSPPAACPRRSNEDLQLQICNTQDSIGLKHLSQ